GSRPYLKYWVPLPLDCNLLRLSGLRREDCFYSVQKESVFYYLSKINSFKGEVDCKGLLEKWVCIQDESFIIYDNYPLLHLLYNNLKQLFPHKSLISYYSSLNL